MSTRAKWALGLAALVVGGLIASLPTLLGGPAPQSQATSYGWTRKLPLLPRIYGSFPAEAKAIARSGAGRELLAVRKAETGGEAVCLEYGAWMAGCIAPRATREIEPFARLHFSDGTSWVGIVAGNVRALRVLRADGSAHEFQVRHGFVVPEGSARPIASLVALDRTGQELGRVAAHAPVAVECTDVGCSSRVEFTGGD